MRRPRSSLLAATLAVLCATSIRGQQPLGSTFRTVASTASRGALVGAAGTLVARFDHDDYVGWGRTTATPNRRVVRGVRFASEDKDGATPENYTVNVYTEDLARPGFPLLTAPLLQLGPFTTPNQPAGLARFTVRLVFPNPLEVPADRDVFVGIGIGTAPTWPNDGFAVQCLLGAASNWPIFDAPGSAPIQHGSYGLAVDAAGTSFYNSSRQLLIDLLCDAPGGSCTTRSNQPSFPIGATATGSGGFLSGLHPDVVSPPAHTGRADDPGFTFLDPTLPDGSAVFFATDLGGFGPEVPLANFAAGSVGVFCLKSPTTVSLGLRLLSGGEASLVIPVNASVRGVLQGLPLLHQSIALGPNLTLRGSPCGRQLF